MSTHKISIPIELLLNYFLSTTVRRKYEMGKKKERKKMGVRNYFASFDRVGEI